MFIPSSCSARASPVHEASQVHPSLHSPAVMDLVHIKIARPIIEYAIECVADTVDYAVGRPSSSRGRRQPRNNDSFTTFVDNVITRAEVTMPTLLVALVYVDRVKPHLNIALEEWALERVFLGALIVASKYLNDSTLKNIHWAMCTGVFGKRDVGRIEREFLDVLDFELSVSEDDLLSHHERLSAIVFPTITTHTRRSHHPHVHHPRSPNAMPELSPSSPESSSIGSSSPRTPDSVTFGISPQPKSRQKSHHHYATATLDLLRSFPIPISTVSSSLPQQQHYTAPQLQHAVSYPLQITA